MKKTILTLTILLSFGIMFTSCKETKKEEVKTETHEHDSESTEHEGEEMAANHTFQCPMDCEKGKTYEEKGSCPVCKMDLKEKKSDSDESHKEDHDKNANHESDEDAEHKEGGEEHK